MSQGSIKKADIEADINTSASIMDETAKPTIHDEVFGEITEHGPNYRALGWKGTTLVMLKTQIGLGVLTIPEVFSVLGLIPGVICIVIVGSMITWSNVIVGDFKRNHPEIYGIQDVGRMFLGRFGYEFFGWLFILYWICTASASFIGLSTCFNALSDHGVCTAVFVAVSMIIAVGLGTVQTLGHISWLAWVGFGSILVSIITLTISVGVQTRPAAAPPSDGPWVSDYVLFGSPSPGNAFAAVSTIVFSFAGTPAFFNIVSEMRDPRDYTRSVMICQTFMLSLYLCIGIVVYYYSGSYVSSPALGSAGALMKKVCYGLALPGLSVSSAMFIHFTAKYLFLRFLRGSPHLTQNTRTHWAVWVSCTSSSAILAYIIASAIPVLSGLVSLVGAFGGTLMSMQIMGFMWLYDNWLRKRSIMWIITCTWAILVIVAGTFLTTAGSYGAVYSIIEDFKSSGGTAVWTCADNS